MLVTFVNNGSLVANLTTSAALDQPTVSVGDVLVAFLFSHSGSANTISPPDGTWSEIAQAYASGSQIQYAAFWKTATATTGTHTFTKATNDGVTWGGAILAWTSQNASNPVDATTPTVSDNSTSADNVTFAAFDPTRTDAHIVFAAYYANDLTTFAAGMSSDTNPDCTTRLDAETAIGNDFSLAITSGDTTDGANIPSRTWASNSTADAPSVGLTFALVPLSPITPPATTISIPSTHFAVNNQVVAY